VKSVEEFACGCKRDRPGPPAPRRSPRAVPPPGPRAAARRLPSWPTRTDGPFPGAIRRRGSAAGPGAPRAGPARTAAGRAAARGSLHPWSVTIRLSPRLVNGYP